MEDALREIANTLLDDVPERIVRRSAKLVLQSRAKINLKPNEEPARSYICVLLAAEAHAGRPLEARPPIPPQQFTKLVDTFRQELGFVDTTASAPQTPRKRRREGPLVSENSPRTPAKTPQRRAQTPQSARTPRTPRNSRAKDPEPADIVRLATELDLKPPTIKAIQHGYLQYNHLVKDRWGLLLGLAYIVISRAEPQQQSLATRLANAVAVAGAKGRLEEWIHWATHIVTGQSWITQVAVEPEPIRKLYTGPGDWC